MAASSTNKSANRNCHRMCSVKKNVLENSQISPMLESLSNKVAGIRPATLLKRLQHRCFSVKFVKFLRTPILKKIRERLLLNQLNNLKAQSFYLLLACYLIYSCTTLLRFASIIFFSKFSLKGERGYLYLVREMMRTRRSYEKEKNRNKKGCS